MVWGKEGIGTDVVDDRNVYNALIMSCLKYVTAEGWEGLITKEGKVVTPPVFWSISAVNKNLYLCKYDTSEDHGILVNEKGERVIK